MAQVFIRDEVNQYWLQIGAGTSELIVKSGLVFNGFGQIMEASGQMLGKMREMKRLDARPNSHQYYLLQPSDSCFQAL